MAGGVTNRVINHTDILEDQLLAGHYYINVPTATNGGGEIRDNLVVPESSAVVPGLMAASTLLRQRRK